MTAAGSRLHIRPFSPDILRAIIPPALASAAQNVSFHRIQTFPENDYGYVDLPAMEAEKLKKKLNGSILKGKKLKVEDARPQKRRRNEEDAEKDAQQPAATATPSPPNPKKAKKDPKVVAGHEISPDRKVKRGWTEVKSEKLKGAKQDESQRPSSKFSEHDELLFRTTVPPNRVEKPRKDRKREKKSNRDIVHEFEKSTAQPSFLRDGDAKGKTTASYVDGQGWIDKDGHVLEQEIVRPLRQRRLERSGAGVASVVERKKSLVDTSLDSSEIGSDSVSQGSTSRQPGAVQTQVSDETSSSGSSESESSSEVETSSAQLSSSPRLTTTTDVNSPPEDVRPQSQPEIHPLEALFKKPSNPASQDIAKPSLEVQTSFSFFDPNKDDIEDEPVMPSTPFSSRDLRSRDHRSAAPTPDTAHPSRFNSYGSTMSEELGKEAEEEEERQDERGTRSRDKKSANVAEPSDFEKIFWEKRGDNNRAWKQKRRETLKEKRQKENRARKGRSW